MSVLNSSLYLLLCVLFTLGVNAQYGNVKPPSNPRFDAAPIASPARDSSSFALVNDFSCDNSVVAKVYKLYTKNTMVFQTCVAEGNYRIFPFSGTHPTTEQIGAMARSLACRAIFSSVLLGGLPACQISNFPMRAAAETLLKIGVDMDKNPDADGVVPSTERFLQMMHWRHNVNLAQALGLPCDSESQLYAEYSSNLYTVATNGLVRLTSDLLVEYRSTSDGSFSQEEIIKLPKMPALRGAKTNAATKPCDESLSASKDDVVGDESDLHQSTDGTEREAEAEAFTSAVTVTSNAAPTSWAQARAAVVAAVLAMLVLA
ncbi:hypothetical protein PR001_g7283 [Phytophthora rubi]|uniref:Elicitin n=1 Tax=Phytophthora rubi TaxID=129364 RepID=A0A6A3NDA5_9STRA|nr:hypothetical protein PR001_g7283 [Phytophthora rubi]KAE9045243.1 hypothetical protein PR002_g2342 [Phytophthora rubi]